MKQRIFSVARRDFILVVPNTMLRTKLVSASVIIPTGEMKDGNQVTKTVAATKVELGNTIDWLKLTLPESTSIPDQRVTVVLQSNDTGSVLSSMEPSDNKVYLYSYSSKDNMQTLGLVLAIIMAALSCGCCLLGVKQFYHLIRLAQLFYMLALINAPFKAASIFGVFSGFWLNLFSIVPNPAKIDEFNGVQCQPPIDFFGESLSCHVYNSLRNYVLGFIIFIIVVGFVQYNKFTETQFFHNLTHSIRLRMFFWSILPDVLIGVYLNIVAPVSNSVLSIGGVFCMLLIMGYTLMFSSTISDYFDDKEAMAAFLSHFSFSRSPLTSNDARLGAKLTAVLLDQLKAIVIVTMIALFYNAPKTQMGIVFVVYILHAIYLIVIRPWNGIFQNVFYAITEVCFFLIVLLMYISQDYSETLMTDTRESRISGGQIALFFIIFFANLVIYIVPVLKGEDLRSTVMQQTAQRESTEDDDGLAKKSGSSGNLAKLDGGLVQQTVPEGTKPTHNESASKSKIMTRDIPTADGNRRHQNEGESTQHLKRDQENTLSKSRVVEPPKQHHSYGPPGDLHSSQVETHGATLPGLGDFNRKVPNRPVDQSEIHRSADAHTMGLQNSANPSVSDLTGSQLPAIRTGKQQVRKTFKPQPHKLEDQI